jgi:uncharacterized damage-inducible protein DinB
MISLRVTVGAALALVTLVLPVAAQQPTQQSAAVAPPAMLGTKGVLIVDVNDIESKFLKLAEATAAKYDYRPGAGVRSVAEVYAHIAAANYWLPTHWGVKIPDGVNPTDVGKLTDKAQIVEHLKKSFAHVKTALAAVPEADLDKATKLFGQDATIRRAQILTVNHMHEHLGQAIAYARANGVTPPWSGGGD